MPWPNRIRDGRYTLEGNEQQLPITEVAAAQREPRAGALGGLGARSSTRLESVTVGYRLHPQPGWDHPLDLRTTYVLDDSGPRRDDRGAQRRADSGAVRLRRPPLPRDRRPPRCAEVAARRCLPRRGSRSTTACCRPRAHSASRAARSTSGSARAVGDTASRHRLHRRRARRRRRRGAATVASSRPRRIVLWADEAFPWLQVFTASVDEGAGRARHRRGADDVPGRRLQLRRLAHHARARARSGPARGGSRPG